MSDLTDAKVLVIGGAGFVGSHVVDLLLDEPVREVVVLDNLVRGTRSNVENALQDDRVSLVEGSVADTDLLARTVEGADAVVHLAALWLWECVHDPRSA
ncbi:MAG: NAD-dependent epimerase/dehydratase family protein, partial [Dehalococcoidia bacterium]